ncbi:MAG: REP-associated tyrosine transposase [Thermodesulfobacteriota bacterium]
MTSNFRRKANRLRDFNYCSPFCYFVTICTADKRKVFTNSSIFSEVVNCLKESATRHNFQIFAYCFMPDHLHLLIGANESEADLIKFIKLFKQRTGYEYGKKYKVKLWQKSFYDHIIRKEESLIEKTRYILENPIRKGLVIDFREYPFLGSMIFDINEL